MVNVMSVRNNTFHVYINDMPTLTGRVIVDVDMISKAKSYVDDDYLLSEFV